MRASSLGTRRLVVGGDVVSGPPLEMRVIDSRKLGRALLRLCTSSTMSWPPEAAASPVFGPGPARLGRTAFGH